MLKIDRVVQSCEIVDNTKYDSRIFNENYTLIPEENGTITVKTNVGKTIGKGLNDGVFVSEFKMYNETIVGGLGLKLIRNNIMEFMIDIETEFKMIDCKNIVISFHNALTEFDCKRITNTFKAEKGVKRDKQTLIGVKGYKNNHYQIKLYSKCEERKIPSYDRDIIRFEVILDKYSIDTLKLTTEINDIKIKEFMKEFLGVWKKAIGRKNRHSTNTFELIARIEENL
ncbi:MAG: hypothetical protein ACRCZ1_04580 [Cetobacterium sp.]